MRGWNPLNRALLLHPEIEKAKSHDSISTLTNSDSSGSNVLDPNMLNISRGKSNEVITDIVQYYVRNDKANANFKKRKLEGESLASKIKDSKRLTAGVLFNAGHVGCDEEVLNLVESKCKERNKAASDKALKVFQTYLDRKRTVDELKSNGVLELETSKIKSKDLRVLVQWYRRNDDDSLPKTIKGLQGRYEETKMRSDLTAHQFLQTKNVFDKYKAETKGLELTMTELEQMNDEITKKIENGSEEDEEGVTIAAV